MPVTLKPASDLRNGDKVLTPNMRILTVESIVAGKYDGSVDIFWREESEPTNLRSKYNVNLV